MNQDYMSLSNDFSSLLKDLHRSKGSVAEKSDIPLWSTDSVSTTLSTSNPNFRFLPPVKQGVFESFELNLLYRDLFSALRDCRILMIHKLAKAALFNGEMYGSQESRQQSSSMVMASIQNRLIPCFVQKFFEITVQKSPDSDLIKEIVVKVSKLVEHQEKDFFGYPVELWQCPKDIDDEHIDHFQYIFFRQIVTRCAYLCKDSCVSVNQFFCNLIPLHVDLKLILVCPLNFGYISSHDVD